MSVNIGPRIAVDGYSEYKKNMDNVVSQVKALQSEMKATATSWDNATKAMDKHKSATANLNAQIDAQRKIVEQNRKMLEKTVQAYGEGSTEANKYRTALANSQSVLNQLEKNLDKNGEATEEYTKSLEDNKKAVDDTTKSHEGLVNVLKGVGTAFVGIVASAGAMAVELGKSVVQSYAEFEQLEGGVKKLFGDDMASTVIANANKAFATAGLDANAYMETVTGFSASLISSLGGDTKKAAELADKAIIDMSDNANTFGTDMQSIQNAYQGFAKGQYNMLDNLRLGYGGTKTEMERLLKDAEKLSGQKFDLSNYGDIIEAIHIVQEDMNIAGATAKEATTTIEGSLSALQSSFANLITGFGNANADINQLVTDVATNFQNVFNNIAPIIENIVASLPALIQGLMPIITDMLPTILQTATSLFTEVLNGLVSALPMLIPVIVEATNVIVAALIDNLPAIIDGAIQLVIALADGISENLDTLIPAIVSAIVTITTALIEHLPELIASGIQLIIALASGLIQAIPQLVKELPKIISAIKNTFANTDWKSIGRDIIEGIKNGVTRFATNLYNSVKEVANKVVDKAKSVLGINSPSKVFAEQVGKFIPEGISLGIDKNVPAMLKDAEKQFSMLETTLPTATNSSTMNYGGFVINVNAQDGQSARQIADEVMDLIQMKVSRKEAVFG